MWYRWCCLVGVTKNMLACIFQERVCLCRGCFNVWCFQVVQGVPNCRDVVGHNVGVVLVSIDVHCPVSFDDGHNGRIHQVRLTTTSQNLMARTFPFETKIGPEFLEAPLLDQKVADRFVNKLHRRLFLSGVGDSTTLEELVANTMLISLSSASGISSST